MKKVFSVTDLTKYISSLITGDKILQYIYVKGEISNFKHHSSGHMYFTIKDKKSILKCIMFKSNTLNIVFNPKNGLNVILEGRLSVYEKDGIYQLYVNNMHMEGMGDLHIEFEKLKKKLKEEGLFDEKHKKKLPFFPENIGLVTSKTGSVLKDIVNVSIRRYPGVSIKVFPVPVQGENAEKVIIKTINMINKKYMIDVIILARGGGSLEELFVFNNEMLARCIFKSNIPIVSAIGHETDFTISDFVSDLRAPTPSAAAELVVPEKKVLVEKINYLKRRMSRALERKHEVAKLKYEKIISTHIFRNPVDIVDRERIRLDSEKEKLSNIFKIYMNNQKNTLENLFTRFDSISPVKLIKKGYSFVRNEQDEILKSIDDVEINDKLSITLVNGIVKCTVYNKEKREIDG